MLSRYPRRSSRVRSRWIFRPPISTRTSPRFPSPWSTRRPAYRIFQRQLSEQNERATDLERQLSEQNERATDLEWQHAEAGAELIVRQQQLCAHEHWTAALEGLARRKLLRLVATGRVFLKTIAKNLRGYF